MALSSKVPWAPSENEIRSGKSSGPRRQPNENVAWSIQYRSKGQRGVVDGRRDSVGSGNPEAGGLAPNRRSREKMRKAR